MRKGTPSHQRTYHGHLNPPQLKLKAPTPSPEAASIQKHLVSPIFIQLGRNGMLPLEM